MSIINATTGQFFATVSAAITASNSGDDIRLSAGTYAENFPKITHSLTIRGVGGMAHLVPPAGGLANDQGLLVINGGAFVRLNNLELSGAVGPSNNDAGVRFETGGKLVISHCYIHDNQDGVLANPFATATILIRNSEFSHNGAGDGRSHNLYVGKIGTLRVTDSYFHDAVVGHEIKSRADRTIITNNRIVDGPDATASYEIDLPEGGRATVTGNLIEKGVSSQNSSMIHFGGEVFPVYPNSALTISDNIVVNSYPSPNFVLNHSQDALGRPVPIFVTGNTFYGMGPSNLGSNVVASGNIFAPGLPADIAALPVADFAGLTLASGLTQASGAIADARLASPEPWLPVLGGSPGGEWDLLHMVPEAGGEFTR